MNAKPKIMGVLNVTPDSCFDGGWYFELEQAVAQGRLLAQQGADLIDVGGESTRPGAEIVSEAEELRRTIPVIEALQELDLPISIDTYKPAVARAAVAAGARFVNDISGGQDPAMRRLVAESGVTLCLVHMQGTPRNMQSDPHYPEGVIPTLLAWFEQRIKASLAAGVQPQQLVIDPGIGFGKTVAHNLEILRNLSALKKLGFPVLLGASRKWFMIKLLKKPRSELLSATLAVHTMALAASVDIVRVHDVVEHRDAVDLFCAIFR